MSLKILNSFFKKPAIDIYSNAASDRKWYNDGSRDYFLKSFDTKDGLFLGRLANRKQ
jgi:hypothetical protein